MCTKLMCIKLILTVAVITIMLFTYNLMGQDGATKHTQTVISKIAADSDLNVQKKLDKLTSVLQSYQQINQEQVKQAQLEQTQLKDMLAELDARLGSLESEVPEKIIGTTESNNDKQDIDMNLSSNDAGNSQAGVISEADLGHWIDETLDAGHWDWDQTTQASEQATSSLEKLPGVTLENMQCGDRFCRATLAHEDGKQPDIGDLIGEPPFVNDGFTINEPDGRVSVYFAGNGISLEDLRNDAQGVAQ